MKELGGSVASYLSQSAKERPDQPALVSGAPKPAFPSLSFLELDRKVDSAADELVKAGIHNGDKTLLFVNPGPGLIIWAFALFRIGATPVVIDPGMGFRSFLKCIQRTRPSALVGISRAIWLSKLLPRTFSSVQKRYLVRSVHHDVSRNKTSESPHSPVGPMIWPRLSLPRALRAPPKEFVTCTAHSIPKFMP